MHRYQPLMPRFTLGLAAATMTAASIGLFVVAPAIVEGAGPDSPALVQSTGTTLASLKAASDTAIDLVALHEEEAELVAPCTLSDKPTQIGENADE
jgi:hypothetical protein